MSKDYSVKKGDTLWGIAKYHGLTIKQLANYNGLDGVRAHNLKIGQLIHLEPVKQTKKIEVELTIKLLDLIFNPIKKATLRLEYDGKIHLENITEGEISNLCIEDHSKGLKVYFKNITGQFDLIADHKRLPVGRKIMTLTSRSVKVKGAYTPKDGVAHRRLSSIQRELKNNHRPITNPPQSSPPSLSESKDESKSVEKKLESPLSGTTKKVDSTTPPQANTKAPLDVHAPEITPINQTIRTDGGDPTHVVAVQFTEDNLLLSKENIIYKQYIIAAANLNGFTPQGMAALINAEAAKLKNGEWNPKSYNSDSNAGGMTQFLQTTWLEMCKNKSSLVGKFVANYPKISESEKLNLRFNPEFAIDAAATYAKSNIDALKSHKLPVEQIKDPVGRAKLAYLLHHEGAGGAYQFITNTITAERAKRLLFTQFGKKQAAQAEAYLKRYKGDAKVAYGHWLRDYIDNHIILSHFTVVKSNLPDEVSIDKIITQLGGVSLEGDSSIQSKSNSKSIPASSISSPTLKKDNVINSKTVLNSSKSTPPLLNGVGGENGWHDPLSQCILRKAGLASPKGATFGYVRTGKDKKTGKIVPRAHQGVDLAADPGTDIYAVASGVIVDISNNYGDYGQGIVLQVDLNDLPSPQKTYALNALGQNAEYVYFFYAHLSSIDVERKQPVSVGDKIGKSGHSGNANPMTTISKGAHLHFEARTIKVGHSGLIDHIDPIPFISVKLI